MYIIAILQSSSTTMPAYAPMIDSLRADLAQHPFLLMVCCDQSEGKSEILRTIALALPNACLVSRELITNNLAREYRLSYAAAATEYKQDIDNEYKMARVLALRRGGQVIVDTDNLTCAQRAASLSRIRPNVIAVALALHVADPHYVQPDQVEGFRSVLLMTLPQINTDTPLSTRIPLIPPLNLKVTPFRQHAPYQEILFDPEELVMLARLENAASNYLPEPSAGIRSVRGLTGWAPGAPWNPDEKQALRRAYANGGELQDIAASHNRTPHAIIGQLKILGCISEDQGFAMADSLARANATARP